jgi:uncharacterized SAM-binding protein YcdF (DUF218 family)
VFLLKKIISGMLMPLHIVLALLIAGVLLLWFSRRQALGKALVTAAMFLLLIEGFGLFADQVLQSLERMYHPVDIQEVRAARVKWVVVLAGGTSRDDFLPVTSQISPETHVRMNEGIRIHRLLPGSKLLVSGGKVFGTISSAELMARLAVELGVNPRGIVLEDKSRDTADEADLIKPMVGAEPFILVTSAYHMPRSMALFKARGMHPVAAPTGHYAIPSDGIGPGDFFPRSTKIYNCEIVVHEILGLLAFQIREALSQ